jgi:hypothetical protein
MNSLPIFCEPQPELVLALQPLLAATSGALTSSQELFQRASNPHDVMLEGTGRPGLWSSAANDEDDFVEKGLAPQTPMVATAADDSPWKLLAAASPLMCAMMRRR